jgi:hypothetical protein
MRFTVCFIRHPTDCRNAPTFQTAMTQVRKFVSQRFRTMGFKSPVWAAGEFF